MHTRSGYRGRGVKCSRVKKSRESLCDCDDDLGQSLHQYQGSSVLPNHHSPVLKSKKVQQFTAIQKLRAENSQERCSNQNTSPSPIIGNKRKALQPSKVENMSPIIGSKRRVLQPIKVTSMTSKCKQSRSSSRGNEKENQVALRSRGKQESLLSPLRERMNVTLAKKETSSDEEACKKQPMRRRSAIADKENVSITSIAQTPVRKSKRIKTNIRNKNVRNVLKAVNKVPSDGEQNLKRISPQKNKPSRGGVCSLETWRKMSPLPRARSPNHKTMNPCTSTSPQSGIATTRAMGKVSSSAASDKGTVSSKNHKTVDGMRTVSSEKRSTRNVNGKLQLNKKGRNDVGKCDETSKVSSAALEDKRLKDKGTPPTGVIKSPSSLKKSSAKPQNSSRNQEATAISAESQGINQNKSRKPVWASVKGTNVTPGKRKSMRINSDVYEFSFSLSTEEVERKKRRVAKPRNKVKRKPKPHTKLTLLTTDLSWQKIPKNLPLSVTMASVTNRRDVDAVNFGASVTCDTDVGDASIPSNMSSIRGEENDTFDPEFDFAGCDGEDYEEVFHEFEGETASSFVPQKKAIQPSVPMVSACVVPTPALSKHISKYIGGSSTPRAEIAETSAVTQKCKTDDDSIAQCFGFDESDEESELNLSPVQQSRTCSSFEVTGTSDVTSGEFQPPSLPSRFSWGSLRVGNRSTVSTTRSSSMVAQGRSLSFMKDVSGNSQSKITSYAVLHSLKRKFKDKPHKKDSSCHKTEQNTVSIAAQSVDDKEKEVDISVLFEDEEVKESQLAEGTKEKQTSQLERRPLESLSKTTVHHSPEKNFKVKPRKSYDRSALLETRRKFAEMHGGYYDSENEEDNEENKEVEEENKQKRCKKRKKPPKKNTEKRKDTPEKDAKKRKDTFEKNTKKRKDTLKKDTKKRKNTLKKDTKRKKDTSSSTTHATTKKNNQYDESAEEWASHLNSHFSEVEESSLMVEYSLNIPA